MVGTAFPSQHRQALLTLCWDLWILTDGQEVRPEAGWLTRGEDAWARGATGRNVIHKDWRRWDANTEKPQRITSTWTRQSNLSKFSLRQTGHWRRTSWCWGFCHLIASNNRDVMLRWNAVKLCFQEALFWHLFNCHKKWIVYRPYWWCTQDTNSSINYYTVFLDAFLGSLIL